MPELMTKGICPVCGQGGEWWQTDEILNIDGFSGCAPCFITHALLERGKQERPAHKD